MSFGCQMLFRVRVRGDMDDIHKGQDEGPLGRVAPEHRRRGKAAATGAALGAVAGSVLGGPVGAALGGALGAAIGVGLNEKLREEDDGE